MILKNTKKYAFVKKYVVKKILDNIIVV